MPLVGMARMARTVCVVGMARVVGVRPAVPPVRPAHASRAAPALARTSSAQARQGAGYGFGGVILSGAHKIRFYMRLDMDHYCMSHYIYMHSDKHMPHDI